MPARRPFEAVGTSKNTGASGYISAAAANLPKGAPPVSLTPMPDLSGPDVSMATAPATQPPRAGGTLLPDVAEKQRAYAMQQQVQQQQQSQLPGMAAATTGIQGLLGPPQQGAQKPGGGQSTMKVSSGTDVKKGGDSYVANPADVDPDPKYYVEGEEVAKWEYDAYHEGEQEPTLWDVYEEEAMKGPMSEDPKVFKDQISSYVQVMTRKMKEAMYLASGSLDMSLGTGQRGLGQIQTAYMTEMSGQISNMIVDHWKQKKQDRIQWLQTTNQALALQEQKQLNVMNAYMQGVDKMMEWMNAEGMGQYMGDVMKAVQRCGEVGESMVCLNGVFEGFRLDHTGNLAWGEEVYLERLNAHQHDLAEKEKECGWWNPACWTGNCNC